MSGSEDLDDDARAARAFAPEAFRSLCEVADDPTVDAEVRDSARQAILSRMDVLRWCASDPTYSAEDRAMIAGMVRRFSS